MNIFVLFKNLWVLKISYINLQQTSVSCRNNIIPNLHCIFFLTVTYIGIILDNNKKYRGFCNDEYKKI